MEHFISCMEVTHKLGEGRKYSHATWSSTMLSFEALNIKILILFRHIT